MSPEEGGNNEENPSEVCITAIRNDFFPTPRGTSFQVVQKILKIPLIFYFSMDGSEAPHS